MDKVVGPLQQTLSPPWVFGRNRPRTGWLRRVGGGCLKSVGPVLVSAGLLLGVLAAAATSSGVAQGSPTCTNVGPTTTVCQSPGNVQVVT